MISAFTLVRVSPEKNVHVFEKVKKLPMIKEATLVYGEYDIIVKTWTKNMEELNKFIYNVLRKTPFITMTTTMIVARIPKKE
ncbi:MAG: Lrp/AsnC ligand binding domain-containing protein [Candidatus Bathyarchaeota archaeon]|nr:Lrp/AsnC ligand binding domain-containing protein [Candidatus Bathyarchaeota archaeon]